MYIIKNALRCISRSKGRNILIGVIVLVIAVSSCIGLSIRQAAENAKNDTMESMSVTATISFDRSSLMQGMMRGEEGGEPPQQFDRSQFASKMGEFQSLSLEEYEKYAAADSVKDFYYTMSLSLNGNDDFSPVSNDEGTDTDSNNSSSNVQNQFGGMFGGKGGGREFKMGVQSDFTVEGVSGETAMTSFINGTASITDGTVFDEGTESYDCIISEELATYNGIEVGGSITLTNPNNEEEAYTVNVVGLYTDNSANESSFSMMGATSTDPANKIYMSYSAVKNMVEASAAVSETQTDENTGAEFETAITGMLNGTYVFADTDSYYKFEEQVRELGLDESYAVASTDITAFENSLVPLNTLSTMAGYFLIVILLIGAIILIVLNIFNIRERKYEIGVLTAIGMKKQKVAMQFITEIFAVTIAAVIIGIGIGAVSSVPITNALLENQIASQESSQERVEQSFGRGGGQMPQMNEQGTKPDIMGGGFGAFGEFFGAGGRGAADYVSEINSAMNFTVVLQMFGIAVLLTIVSGMVSMMFVMRYEPLKILANRD